MDTKDLTLLDDIEDDLDWTFERHMKYGCIENTEDVVTVISQLFIYIKTLRRNIQFKEGP